MTNEQIFVRIREIIIATKSDTVVIEPHEIRPESELGEAPLAMDSIDYVSMIIGIEEAFGIIAEDEDFLATSMQRVSEVVEAVRLRLGTAAEGGG